MCWISEQINEFNFQISRRSNISIAESYIVASRSDSSNCVWTLQYRNIFVAEGRLEGSPMWSYFKVVIAGNLFSSDIVKLLLIYYYMLLEYMCKVSKLLIIQNPRKLSLKKEVKHRIPYAAQKLNYIFHHSE